MTTPAADVRQIGGIAFGINHWDGGFAENAHHWGFGRSLLTFGVQFRRAVGGRPTEAVHLIDQVDDAPWVVRGVVPLRAAPCAVTPQPRRSRAPAARAHVRRVTPKSR